MKVLGKMKNQISILLAVCLCLLGSPVMTSASVPQLMSYQGLLKDAQGSYLTGTYDMTFRIYNAATGGTALWTEAQTGVSATSGRFNVELGSVTALNLLFNMQYWLSVQVGSDPEMTPRVKLTSIGYAYTSNDSVNGFTGSEHDSKSHMDVEGVKANTSGLAKTNFKLDAYSSASANNMGNMIVDVFKDESGIDTNSSSHYRWQGSPNYSVTTQPANNPTGLLLHCNGTNGSTAFVDASSTPKTVTANGNAQIDTAQKKFGTASGSFDGNDSLELADSTDWTQGSNSFTIDSWVQLNSLPTLVATISCQYQNGSNHRIFYIVQSGGVYRLGFYSYVSGSFEAALSGPITVNTGEWHHAAVVRNGNNFNLYWDGNSVASTTSSNALTDLSGKMYLGTYDNGAIGYFLDGRIDEYRYTPGTALWTGNFTPPTSEYTPPIDPATVISSSFSSNSTPDEAMVIGDETLNDGAITYYVSRDNGTHWTEATNGEVVSLASQPSGSNIRWKAGITETAELKGIAVALS